MMKLQIFDPRKAAGQLPEMEFHQLAAFDEGGVGVFWSRKGGPSPWEIHPDCDELLHIIEGEIDVEVLPAGDGESSTATLAAGEYLVIPRGCWHRQYIRMKTTELYLTPGRTLHSTAEDPRVDGS